MTSLAQQSYSTGYARGSPPGFEGDLYLQQQFSRGEMPPRPCRYEDRSPRGESPEGRQSGGEDRPACDYATGAMSAASLHQYSSCIPGMHSGSDGGYSCDFNTFPSSPYGVQRHAANIRGRRRVLSVSSAFDELRCRVPTFPFEKRLSKIDTLRLAIAYIALLREILASEYDPLTHIEKCLRGELKGEHSGEWNTSDLTA